MSGRNTLGNKARTQSDTHHRLLSPRSLKPPRLDDPRAEDEKGIMESVAKIHGLVSEESKHVPSERIVVGGFSQGAALSLLVSLTTEKKVSSLLPVA